MLAIQPSSSSSTKSLTPNLLPCQIKHSGPIRTSKRHWNPTTTTSPSQNTKHSRTTYLRGRKLLGKSIPLPENYTGKVLQKTDRILPAKPKVAGEEEDDEDGEQPVEVKVMEEKGTFQEIVVWGHEAVPEEGDVYVKGMEEWIAFAEAVSIFIPAL